MYTDKVDIAPPRAMRQELSGTDILISRREITHPGYKRTRRH